MLSCHFLLNIFTSYNHKRKSFYPGICPTSGQKSLNLNLSEFLRSRASCIFHKYLSTILKWVINFKIYFFAYNKWGRGISVPRTINTRVSILRKLSAVLTFCMLFINICNWGQKWGYYFNKKNLIMSEFLFSANHISFTFTGLFWGSKGV